MTNQFDREADRQLEQQCAEMAERLREVGKDEFADAFDAVAEFKRNERSPGSSTPPEPEPRSRSADELLEAVERGELTAAEAREQLGDATDKTP